MKSLTIIYRYSLYFLTGLILLSSCNDPHNHEQEVPPEEKSDEYVSLTPEQVQTVGIKLGSFDTIALKNTIKASGMLDLPPQNRATVSNILGGVITKINVIQGQEVKKGEVLASLENPEVLRLQQDYLKAKSNFEYARKEYLRQKELYEEKIVAGKKFQAAEAEYEGQRALINSLENQLIQLGISPGTVSKGKMIRTIPITSPISGFVHRIEVNTGQFVDPAKDIFEIVDNHHIHADLQVYEKDISKVKKGQIIFFTLRGDSSAQYTAQIFSVGKAFEKDTRSVGVHAEIINNKNYNLLPGMYVDGRIQVADAVKAPVLPESAIITEGGQDYIFIKSDTIVHHADGKNPEAEELVFKKVQVKTGVTDLGFVEVSPLEKITNKPVIVTDGAYYLNSQMKKGEGDGHGH